MRKLHLYAALTVSLLLVACDGGSSAPAINNHAPTSSAGSDQTGTVGKIVMLSGAASADADGDPLSYNWTFFSQPAGSSAVLTNTNTVNPTFVPDVAGIYAVRLTVSDGKTSSTADEVLVMVNLAAATNHAPVANAGSDQTATVGQTVTLSGTASTDADNDPLTYSWLLVTRPANSSAILTNADIASPTFVADTVGTYAAQLTVSDGKTTSAIDEVLVEISTPLSGMLSSSITLETSKSPYTLTGDVGIPAGVTLTVQPGVEIIGNNRTLTVEGTLSAVGTPSSRINIHDLNVIPAGKNQPGRYNTIQMDSVDFAHGSLFKTVAGTAPYGTVRITNSAFSNIPPMRIFFIYGDNILERNSFVNTGGISYYT